MTCPNNVCGTGSVPGPKPGDPDNNLAISATQSYGGVDVYWTYPKSNPHAVAHVQLYRSTSHLVVTAIQIAVVAGNTYYDKINEVGTYFYWIKVVSVNGTVGEFIGPASATTRLRSQDTIEDLTGQIDRGVLATTLRKDIEDITSNKNELLNELNEVIADNAALSGAMSDLQNGLTQAVSFVNTEITQRKEGQNALAQQVTVVAAANVNNTALIINERNARVSAMEAVASSVDSLRVATNNNAAAIVSEKTARTSAVEAVARSVDTLRAATDNNAAAILSERNARTTQYSALANKTDTIQSNLDSNIASVRTDAATVINVIDGKIQEIGARWTAQVSVNGLVGGFGVYNDGRFVEAGFDVDRFWVGRTNSNRVKPFIIDNDIVYINKASIRNADIDTLKIAGDAVSVPSGATSWLGGVAATYVNMTEPGRILLVVTANWLAENYSSASGSITAVCGSQRGVTVGVSMASGFSTAATAMGIFEVPAGIHYCYADVSNTGQRRTNSCGIVALGIKR